MSSVFQKSTSNIFVTLLIGLIVVSFMFTGFQTMKGTPDTVAMVDGNPIKAREYQMEFERQLNFFSQFYNGGQPLNSKQIQDFDLKNQTIRNLVTKKVMIGLAEDMGIQPSVGEVKAELTRMPYFLTNEKFDLNKYKAVLAANGLTPTDFEADILAGLKSQRAGEIIGSLPLSNTLMQEIAKYKGEVLGVNFVKLSKNTIEKHIPVSKEEIAAYLAKENNANRVEDMFKDRKSALDQPEQVEARHILLRTDEKNEEEVAKKIAQIKKEVTTRNFSVLAKKYTEDPSGKDNGGYLNWFGRGAMVGAFEDTAFSLKPGTISEPIKTEYGYHIIYVLNKKEAKEATLAEHRDEFAKELIQKSKTSEREELIQKLTAQIEEALKRDSKKELENLEAKYGFTLKMDATINRLDGSGTDVSLNAAESEEVFEAGLDQKKTYIFDKPAEVLFLGTFKAKNPTPVNMVAEKENLSRILGNKMRQDLVKNLSENADVKVYSSRLN